MPSVSSSRRGRRRFVAEINVVPYIDVMLVLLVIFMTTAPMLPPSEITVPSAGQSSAPPDALLELRLSAQGELRAVTRNLPQQMDRRVQRSELAAVLRELGPASELAVLIAADRGIAYGEVVGLMDEVRQAGAGRVGLMVQEGANR
jgi:biopolymer transport protein TolR